MSTYNFFDKLNFLCHDYRDHTASTRTPGVPTGKSMKLPGAMVPVQASNVYVSLLDVT